MHAINTEFRSHETVKVTYFPRKILGRGKCRQKGLHFKLNIFPSSLGTGSWSL